MKEREDERKDPLKSGASNNDDDGGPATDDRFFGFQRSSAAISKQGWGGWMFVSVVVILEVAFILSVLHVSNHCPLLLLRSILQIATSNRHFLRYHARYSFYHTLPPN
jgi:hypothetical protein